jgi:ParB family chromosome partitioning protein
MTDAITISLNKLVPWKGNVRKTGPADGIDELAASIATHGLLQSLVVRKAKNGKYEVIAGRRRYLALKSLAEAKFIAQNHDVSCTIVDAKAQATELSLVENIIRAPMHPADQFEAFRDVIDAGATITDVAARFGIAETLVTRRLKLGRLSPVILDAYRNGDIDLEQTEAFTLSDDREAQERVFAEQPEWQRSPASIRRALTTGEVPATDRRVRFVSLEAYEAAGGAIRRDLFDDENGGYLQDEALLDRLVAEKLEALKASVADEGWDWVEIVPDADYSVFAQYFRLYPESVFASEAEQAEHETLSAEYDLLIDDDEAHTERLDEIDRRLQEIETIERWPAETLATAGAILRLDHDGDLRIERGLVRKGSEKGSKSPLTPSRDPAALPAALLADLAAQKSAALGAELMRRPDVALAAVVHTLTLQAIYPRGSESSVLHVSVHVPTLDRAMATPDRSTGLTSIEEKRTELAASLPSDPADLWDWCLERSHDELLNVLAFIAGLSVSLLRTGVGATAHEGPLASALSFNMRSWFAPGADNYFGRVSRTRILAAVDEATGSHAPALEKLKKAELATRASQLVAETTWLPEPLRTSPKAA